MRFIPQHPSLQLYARPPACLFRVGLFHDGKTTNIFAAILTAVAADTGTPERRSAGSAGGEEAVARHRIAAAAAEADALASRHRSLVQRRRRMRSGLRVLEVSERGRAALETTTGSEPAGKRGARAEQAMEVGGSVDQ